MNSRSPKKTNYSFRKTFFKAAQSLYDEKIATFEEDDGYRQDDAEGFIRLNALRLKIYSDTYGKK